MIETLDLNRLNVIFSDKSNKHNTGDAMQLLPFVAKRGAIIKGNFPLVLGQYIRNITGIKINENQSKDEDFYLLKNSHQISNYVAKSIDFQNDEAEYDFIRFIESYLFENKNLQAIHPYIYNFLSTGEISDTEFSKYSKFMSDVFVQQDPAIKEVFRNKDTEDILTEVILNNIDKLMQDTGYTVVPQYQSILQGLPKIYLEDLKFLTNYKDYFLQSFPLLTQFYMFMYPMQLLRHFEAFTNGKDEISHPYFFALEWESLTKKRPAASYQNGFKFVEEYGPNLFPHVHTLSQLSHNFLNKDNDKKIVYSYSQLYKKIQEQGEAFEFKFAEDLHTWVSSYQKWANVDLAQPLAKDIPTLMEQLFKSLKIGMSTSVCTDYGKLIGMIGHGQFLKQRGSLGQVLNIKHDFLMLMTAVIVKNERMPFNTLLTEFRKRGIDFDRHSIKEIVELFNSHNLLDKKSDSGDAQYVKPIL